MMKRKCGKRRRKGRKGFAYKRQQRGAFAMLPAMLVGSLAMPLLGKLFGK